MQVEIDQSGKIGDTKLVTVLAFSNHKSYSIYLSATTKRKLIQTLRTPENSRVFYFRVFAILLFILLKDFLDKIQSIYIDQEYLGHEGDIQAYLIDVAQKSGVTIDPQIIHFIRIGKDSNAHILAITCFRKKKGDKTVSYTVISNYFLPTKKDRGPYRRR